MGWNTSALFVRDRSIEEVLDFLPDVYSYPDTEQRVSADEAWSGSPSGRLYLAETSSWCQLWDPELRFAPRLDVLIDLGRSEVLRGTRALAVMFSSVLSMYGFWLYEDGELVRMARYESGTCVEEHGEPLPIERDIKVPEWGHDEDFVWAVIRAVTGLGADFSQAFAVHVVAE